LTPPVCFPVCLWLFAFHAIQIISSSSFVCDAQHTQTHIFVYARRRRCTCPEVVALGAAVAPQAPEGRQRSLHEIAAELERAGHLNKRGVRYSAASVQHMLAQRG
jgi:hypothetical protein